MKWLTQEYIQAQAKKGPRQALECSIEHWEQFAGATLKELQIAFKNRVVNIAPGFCALCARYLGDKCDCSYCPLYRYQGADCGVGTQWGKVSNIGFEWNRTKRKYPAFHRESGKMAKVLRQVHKKLYGS